MDQGKIVTKTIPLVSVIIPVYNTEAYLEATLLSVLHQTIADMEVIIVNDGSTDNSLSLLERIAAKDKRVHLYSQLNQGQSVARNTGITQAIGKYIYFMDSDDLLEPDTLEMCLIACEKNHLDFVFFDADILNKKNDYTFTFSYQRTHLFVPERVYKGLEILNLQLEKWGYSASPCLSFIRRDYLNRIQLRFYPGIIHEDELFTALLYLQATRVGCIPRTFFHRRLRDNSTMTRHFTWKNMHGYFTVTEQLLLFAKDKDVNTRSTVDKFLSNMLDAAVYLAHVLPLPQRLQILQRCLLHYRSYLHPKTYLVLLLKSYRKL